ncbi:MAG: nitroreductase [Pseudomonadota bacterium]
MTEITALTPRPDVLDFLLTRRSRPAKTLRAPGPDRDALEPILQAALRVPDHGKLEPWRLAVLTGDALERLAALAEITGAAQGLDPDKIAKGRAMFAVAPCIVAVIATPEDSAKIPEVEQTLSAGAVCTTLVTAALAAGWGANWLTGWVVENAVFRRDGLGLADHEWIAGLIVIGTEGPVPPERPRPDPTAKIAWIAT